MNRLKPGLWDIVDQSLRWVGRSAVWLLTRKSGTGGEGSAYALIGGALICTVFGGVAGFGLSGHARNMVTMEGAILGCLLGACVGVFLGSLVEAVDDTINQVLRSLNSK